MHITSYRSSTQLTRRMYAIGSDEPRSFKSLPVCEMSYHAILSAFNTGQLVIPADIKRFCEQASQSTFVEAYQGFRSRILLITMKASVARIKAQVRYDPSSPSNLAVDSGIAGESIDILSNELRQRLIRTSLQNETVSRSLGIRALLYDDGGYIGSSEDPSD